MLFPAVLNPLCAAAVGEGLWVTHQPGSGQPFYFSQATCRPVLEVNSSLPPSFTNGCKSCRCRNLNTNPGEPGTIVLLPWYLFVTSVTLQSLANSSCVKKGQGVSASLGEDGLNRECCLCLQAEYGGDLGSSYLGCHSGYG